MVLTNQLQFKIRLYFLYWKEKIWLVLPTQELEKLRLAKLLIDDMGVNLPGVEIILRMRQSIYAMRRQFDDILEDLAGRLRETLEEKR